MDVVKEIIQNSAIGPLPNSGKAIVAAFFVAIVCTLLVMLTLLILFGSTITFHYGY
ncbi:hypothetical protein [Flagellimonas amoyensis]|uniref:hypothetical protein n=1 Tax=Flagellimonas amoyensis TaxID=2169401 RepID=UPI00131F356C|nr:hypothetical protein [Allomuricauda amoyensis]